MSTPSNGAPRRRRIAGERRGARPAGPGTSTGAGVLDPAPSYDEPPTGAPASYAPPPADPAPSSKRAASVAERPVPTAGWWGSRASLFALTGALAVLVTLGVLASLGLLGVAGFDELAEADEVDRASSSAPAAAERAAQAILVYDHERLEADRRSAVGFMTDDFAKKYTDTFEEVVAPAAEQTSAKVTAEVQASGVVRASADRARVLLFVDQTTVSSANEAPQQALNRVEMIMVREGDRWLVDDVTSY
jgi:Mce-associated membrane protein